MVNVDGGIGPLTYQWQESSDDCNSGFVDIANSGQQALEMMENNTPDLVISSLYLSDQTGTDLVTKIRMTEHLKDIYFMLISSETSFEMLDPIRQAGVVAILPKPFKPKDLKTALNTTLDFINVDTEVSDDIDLAELNVLLVDDSNLARKHIRRVLTNLGMENIDEAINGKDAVEKIEARIDDYVVRGLRPFVTSSFQTHSIFVLLSLNNNNRSRDIFKKLFYFEFVVAI